MTTAIGIFFASLGVVFVIAAIIGIACSLPDRRERRARDAAAIEATIAAIEGAVARLVPADPAPEIVEQLSVRAQAIEVPREADVPREGAVLQGRWTVHDRCLDAWSARDHEGICGACAPVFGKAVKA